MPDVKRASDFVDEKRLWDRQMYLATFGETPKGGVNRQALSAEEVEARKVLMDWSTEIGLTAFVDDIGNLFFRREGTDSALAPVMTGSHIDSQPTGGKFDGSYGVVAAFEAIQAIADAGIELKRPVEVAVWLNEEGSRFAPGMMGSEAYAGVRRLEDMLPVTDREGISVRDALPAALAATPDATHREFESPVYAFLEAHIEQGPVLEAEKKVIGVVTGIQGVRRMRVRVTGEEAHAGTTLTAERKDAIQAASGIVTELYARMNEDPQTKFTIGMMNITPNVPSVIASEVVFSIDIRHENSGYLEQLAVLTETICREFEGACTVEAWRIAESDSVYFDDRMTEAVEEACIALQTPHRRMFSAAGHDARQLSYICPTAMIFVPCEKGISHNEAENATPGDLRDGARVLADVLTKLGNDTDTLTKEI
jgi:beta-ureidopropionase / N-carbamoyl-L-amino-acid hydrolase